MKAGGFWTPGVTAFFDLHVTHANSSPTRASTQREEEEIEPESDTCRDGNFYTTGAWYKWGMGLDCQNLFKNSRK